MSKLINSTGFCLFCYRTIEFPIKTAKTIDNINKFVKFVKRFAEPKQNKCLVDFLEDSKLIECCKKCNIIIKSFCETYHQLKVLEFRLDFMLDKLVDEINYANKVPARWIHVNRVLEETFQTDLEKKAESQGIIRKLRQTVVEAGHQIKVRSQPRVLLNRSLNLAKSSIIPVKMSETNHELKTSSNHQKYKTQKNWRCNVCEKRFTCKQNIRVHLRIHTGEKPFKCRFCQKDFRFKGDFNNHLTDNHGNEKGVEEELKRKWISKPLPDGLHIDDEEFIPKTKAHHSTQKRGRFSLRNKSAVNYSVAGVIETELDRTLKFSSIDDDMIECTTFPNHDDEAECDDVNAELDHSSGEINDDDAEQSYALYDKDYSETNNLVLMEETAIFKDPLIQIKVEHQPVVREECFGFVSGNLKATASTANTTKKDQPGMDNCSDLNPDEIQEREVNECATCGKTFQSAYVLQVHLEYHKNPKDWKFRCKVCERRFATINNLQAHARIHKKKDNLKGGVSVQASASRLRLKYLKNKNCNEKAVQKNIKRKEVLVKEIDDLALDQVKAKNVDIQQNRYSLRNNRVNNFTHEIESDDDDASNDIEYKSAEPSSDTALSSDDAERQTKNKYDPDQPKLKRGRPKRKKSSSRAKLNVECKICSKMFSSFLRKDRHFKTCHDLTQSKKGKLYKCKINGCAAYFLTSVQVRKHRMYDHGKTIKERAEEKGKHIDCPKCDNKFAQEGQLKKHLEYHKDPSEWKWKCETCKRKFAIKFRLMEHMRRFHMADKPYKCKFCEKQFPTSACFNKHISAEHRNEDFNKDEVANESMINAGKIKTVSTADRKSVITPKPKVLECEVCKREFTSFLIKERHFKTHHDLSQITDKLKVEKCGAIGCSAYFLEKSQLKYHTTLEHGLGGLYKRRINCKCEKCGKGFVSRTHLRIHLEYHKNPSEWKCECETCGKKCVNEFKLKNHMRTHTKERPFQCQFCVENFGAVSNLKRHLEKWHKDEEGVRAELDGKKNYEQVKIEKGTDAKAKILKVKDTKVKKAKVQNFEITNSNVKDITVFEHSSVFERETEEPSNGEEKSSENIKEFVNEPTRNTSEVSNAKCSDRINFLTRKGDSFGDGTLVDLEDLD